MEDWFCDNSIRVTLLLLCYFATSGTDDSHSCKRAPFLEKKSLFTFLEDDKNTVSNVCKEEPNGLTSSRNCLRFTPDFHSTKFVEECLESSAKSLPSKGENKSKVLEVKGQTKKPANAAKKLKGSKRQRKKNKKKKLGKKKKKS